MKFQAINYIHIEGWMITHLKLNSNELLCYAIIYGFSMDGESMMTGGIDYMVGALSVSKPTVISLLKKLVEKGLIERIENITDCKRVYYRVKKLNFDIDGVGKETLPTSVKNLNQPLVKKFNHAPINIKDKDTKEENKGKVNTDVFTQKPLKDEDIFKDGMKKNYPNISSMKKPLLYSEYQKLLDTYKKDEVISILKQMENHLPLRKKYISAYLTANNWLRNSNHGK